MTNSSFKAYKNVEYKGMLSMMPRDVIIQYAEDLEDVIHMLVVDGSGPEVIPEITMRRLGWEDD